MASRTQLHPEATSPLTAVGHGAEEGLEVFPTLLEATGTGDEANGGSSSRFRRITRIPAWVRSRATSSGRSGAAAAKREAQNVGSAATPMNGSSVTPRVKTYRIPPSPTLPPPLPPAHLRSPGSVSFGLDILADPFEGPSYRTIDHVTQPAIFPKVITSPPSSPRLRSFSTPFPSPPIPDNNQDQSRPRPRHQSKKSIPRAAIVSSSWDNERPASIILSSSSQGQGRERANTFSSSTFTSATEWPSSPHSGSSTETVTPHTRNIENHLSQSAHRPPQPTLKPPRTLRKLNLRSYFEVLTELDLNTSSAEGEGTDPPGSELTITQLEHALKHLFGRYHGVLDIVGEMTQRVEVESAGLREEVRELRAAVRLRDEEVQRLKGLLAKYGVRESTSEDSNASTDTVRAAPRVGSGASTSMGTAGRTPVTPSSSVTRRARAGTSTSNPSPPVTPPVLGANAINARRRYSRLPRPISRALSSSSPTVI